MRSDIFILVELKQVDHVLWPVIADNFQKVLLNLLSYSGARVVNGLWQLLFIEKNFVFDFVHNGFRLVIHKK